MVQVASCQLQKSGNASPGYATATPVVVRMADLGHSSTPTLVVFVLFHENPSSLVFNIEGCALRWTGSAYSLTQCYRLDNIPSADSGPNGYTASLWGLSLEEVYTTLPHGQGLGVGSSDNSPSTPGNYTLLTALMRRRLENYHPQDLNSGLMRTLIEEWAYTPTTGTLEGPGCFDPGTSVLYVPETYAGTYGTIRGIDMTCAGSSPVVWTSDQQSELFSAFVQPAGSPAVDASGWVYAATTHDLLIYNPAASTTPVADWTIAGGLTKGGSPAIGPGVVYMPVYDSGGPTSAIGAFYQTP
jgi:hypothetical protein